LHFSVFNRCEQHHDCDRSAICSNTYDGYNCQCKPGYLDISPDPARLPGRKCQQLINECGDRTHDCSPYATCEDTQDAFLCKCNEGYTDVSSRYGLKPGRKCAKVENRCSSKSLNSCDENADCVQLPDGYTCKCFNGYIDVSSNANLPPGRVCTLQTTCPAQPTDLVFLIDGSGSISSDVFREEVLRFVKEFIELFDIASDKTRVAVVQYSDRIRHEFDLNQYTSARDLKDAIDRIQYITGLTRTGAAIHHVTTEAFSEKHGARPSSNSVSRVAIVITDGRSQDNVLKPAKEARQQHIQLFAVGVTEHVLDSELENIAGKLKSVEQSQRSFGIMHYPTTEVVIKAESCYEAIPVNSNACDGSLMGSRNGLKGKSKIYGKFIMFLREFVFALSERSTEIRSSITKYKWY
uniref:VWFA domain-containing protein n=1 Tax=Anisakis simplex TaxID=6269 RepID=A0A0M3KES8_ANISI